MCFFIKHGEIRIMSEHASGMFIDQFKNWSILLSDFPVSRKGKSDASESLHLRQEKQISHHRWGICFLFVVGEIRTGHERSERNMPGVSSARVRAGAVPAPGESLHLRQTKPRPAGRGFLFGGNGRVRALAARSAVRDGCPQAGVSEANRRRRLLGRRRENLSISAKKNRSPTIGGGSVFYLWLERFPPSVGDLFFICGWRDSNRARAKREKHAGGMFLLPACVPARCPRRANLSISAKQNPVQPDGVFIISCFPCPSRTGGRAPRPANGPARSANTQPWAESPPWSWTRTQWTGLYPGIPFHRW